MSDPGYAAPPDAETFGYAGCQVVVVDGTEILAAARGERISVLHAASLPAPVTRVWFFASATTRDGEPVHVLEAEIRTAAGSLKDRIGPAVLGSDPIGVLLARRLAAGDPWAARIVNGVGNVTAEAYRRLGLARPADEEGGPGQPAPTGSTVLTDDEYGLRATVNYDAERPAGGAPGGKRITTVRAEVASDVVSAGHLGAMFGLVLRVIAELLGDGDGEPLAGRRFVLSRHPVDDPPDPGPDPAGMPGTAATPRPAEPDGAESVSLDQVGGLPEVVAQFRQIAVSFRHPQVMARWGARRPQGILLYGPPGTGKTMLARALANEIGAKFREIRTPEILDKWLGASERNIKRIFRDARRYREPTVLLFDEFDSIISYAGAGGDAASQAVNAVAGIFKQEMNNLIDENPNVIVVATTNFPHRVDESLIRSGRFDIKMNIPAPDESGRLEIITKMVRDLIAKHENAGFRMFADDLDFARLAQASHGMTGADLKEILRRVRLAKAMEEARTGTAAPIGQDDLERCVTGLRQGAAAS